MQGVRKGGLGAGGPKFGHACLRILLTPPALPYKFLYLPAYTNKGVILLLFK